MNKAELVDMIAKKVNGVSKKTIGEVLDVFTDTVQASLKKGENVALVGLGTFSVSKRAARTGSNPRTGAPIKIPASKVAKFSAGSSLKAAINKN